MRERTRRLFTAAVIALGAALLCINISGDWRYLHEDNGAIYTTLALSHLKAGLHVTRGHDVFIDRETGEQTRYGHHPAGLALLLAGAFRLAGSAEPAVARSVSILFQLASIACVARLLRSLFPAGPALAGTFAFAVLPMGAYFGRMVNYEPLCLFGVLLQLLGFVDYQRTGERRFLWLLGGGIVLSGLVDWPGFFFAAAIGLTGAFHGFRGDVRGWRVFFVAAGVSVSVFAFDLFHLWWASGGSLATLSTVASSSAQGETLFSSPLEFLAGQFDSYRRYFSHTGLVATLLVAGLVLAPKAKLSRELQPRRSMLVASGCAATAYVLAAPSWASVHPYWKFYFLPFVAAAVALLFECLRLLPPIAARTAMALLLVEMAATSAYMLRLRHTREGAYAIETTAKFRARYLRPEDVPLARRER